MRPHIQVMAIISMGHTSPMGHASLLMVSMHVIAGLDPAGCALDAGSVCKGGMSLLSFPHPLLWSSLACCPSVMVLDSLMCMCHISHCLEQIPALSLHWHA